MAVTRIMEFKHYRQEARKNMTQRERESTTAFPPSIGWHNELCVPFFFSFSFFFSTDTLQIIPQLSCRADSWHQNMSKLIMAGVFFYFNFLTLPFASRMIKAPLGVLYNTDGHMGVYLKSVPSFFMCKPDKNKKINKEADDYFNSKYSLMSFLPLNTP